jgi:hypothetical protein
MRTPWKAFLLLACGIAAGLPAHAENPGEKTCTDIWPKPFLAGQPFLLSDPRSGFILYLESDGRHMAAITREGKIVWHRNLFDDLKLETMLSAAA